MIVGQFDDFSSFEYPEVDFDFGPLDFTLSDWDFVVPDMGITDGALSGGLTADIPDAGSAMTLPEFSFPNLSVDDFLKYGSAGLSLWGQYEQVQAIQSGTVAPPPRAPAPTQATVRTVTSPTGERVTQRYSPATGQWTAIPTTSTGAQWVPGIPNIAVVVAGGALAFLALGQFGGGRRR